MHCQAHTKCLQPLWPIDAIVFITTHNMKVLDKTNNILMILLFKEPFK